ncbi:dde superfamily endonuclease [Holotrichia oblita]|uniref:Dde superfamily endonuclease n=1 Tax=Holotrichia oblita TaxID=644536 RepID=A0ACB9TNA0_HOLOL|nr:dde superfamily endonuclease [Holotrichia oblita]
MQNIFWLIKKKNKRLSSCRVFAEHAIGILKQRFRQLYHLKTRHISLLLHQIKACCVLHNLASEDDLQYFEEQKVTSDEEEEDEKEEDNNIDTLNDSKNTRKLLRDLLSSTL